jgi:hypothetical protein
VQRNRHRGVGWQRRHHAGEKEHHAELTAHHAKKFYATQKIKSGEIQRCW